VKEVIVDSRINKILAMRTDSVAMLEALDAISEFYGANTVDARRSLRQGKMNFIPHVPYSIENVMFILITLIYG